MKLNISFSGPGEKLPGRLWRNTKNSLVCCLNLSHPLKTFKMRFRIIVMIISLHRRERESRWRTPTNVPAQQLFINARLAHGPSEHHQAEGHRWIRERETKALHHSREEKDREATGSTVCLDVWRIWYLISYLILLNCPWLMVKYVMFWATSDTKPTAKTITVYNIKSRTDGQIVPLQTYTIGWNNVGCPNKQS